MRDRQPRKGRIVLDRNVVAEGCRHNPEQEQDEANERKENRIYAGVKQLVKRGFHDFRVIKGQSSNRSLSITFTGRI